MKHLFSLCVVVLFLVLFSLAPFGGATRSSLYRRHHRHLYHSSSAPSQPVPYYWIEQKLDHSDPQNVETWKQKYLLNGTYWGGDGYPIFMLLGGEGPISNESVTGHFVLNQYALKFRALIVSAEHRFYGESIPTSDLSTSNLRYLTSAQALADFAVLLVYLKETLNAPNSKVVSFGGSYSGSLSAWFRLKYPHLVHAALASSGPIRAKVDFPEYFDVVADSLSTVPNCYETVMAATVYYNQLISTPLGKKKIEQDFVTCSVLDTDLNVITFWDFLANTISGFVQYNNDNNNYFPYNMENMCQVLMTGPIDTAFPTFIAQWNNFSSLNCSDSSYNNDLATLMDTDPKSPEAAGRSWYYQTCFEFGYYQTGSSSKSPFSSAITLDYFLGMCQAAFGISPPNAAVEANIDWTNNYYGSLNITSSRIFFTNGNIDPWHALGMTRVTSDDLPVVFMQGTAHCADLYMPSPKDLPVLTATRQLFMDYLTLWLQE